MNYQSSNITKLLKIILPNHQSKVQYQELLFRVMNLNLYIKSYL